MQISSQNLYQVPAIPHAGNFVEEFPQVNSGAEANLADCAFAVRSLESFDEELPALMSASSLQPIISLLRTHAFQLPIMESKRQKRFAHSFFILPGENEMRLCISLQGRIQPDPKKEERVPSVRIRDALMLTFGSRGEFKMQKIIKIFAHYPVLTAQSTPEIVAHCRALERRLCALHELAGERYPTTHAALTYNGHSGRSLAIFQEYLAKDLQTFYEETASFGRLSEEQRISFAAQAIRAVHGMHKRGWIHRDIKLANFLLDMKQQPTRLVLTDFGEAVKMQDREALRDPHGTLTWAAPEVIDQGEHLDTVIPIDKSCDTWSLGLLLAALAGQTHYSIEALDKVYATTEKIEFLTARLASLRRLLQTPQRYNLQEVIQKIVVEHQEEESAFKDLSLPFTQVLRLPHLYDLSKIERRLPQKELSGDPTLILNHVQAVVASYDKKIEKLAACRLMLQAAVPEKRALALQEHARSIEQDIPLLFEERQELLKDWKVGIRKFSLPIEDGLAALLELANAMLQVDPQKRLDLEAALHHF